MSALQLDWQPGDILAFHGTSLSCRTIRYGTASFFGPRQLRVGPSHVGIMVHARDWLLVEATSLCRHACWVTGRQIDGAQAHLADYRVHDYVAAGGRVDVYRLNPISALGGDDSRKLAALALHHFVEPGVHYDLPGALLSGTRLLKFSRLLPGADLNQIFCSEMVARLLMEVNRLCRGNPGWFNPASLLRRLVRDGTYHLYWTCLQPVEIVS